MFIASNLTLGVSQTKWFAAVGGSILGLRVITALFGPLARVLTPRELSGTFALFVSRDVHQPCSSAEPFFSQRKQQHDQALFLREVQSYTRERSKLSVQHRETLSTLRPWSQDGCI